MKSENDQLELRNRETTGPGNVNADPSSTPPNDGGAIQQGIADGLRNPV